LLLNVSGFGRHSGRCRSVRPGQEEGQQSEGERENLTLTEYIVLMALSESPDRARRMSDLIGEVPITASG
jgi:DNA-binding MarR family transcriptional regulator